MMRANDKVSRMPYRWGCLVTLAVALITLVIVYVFVAGFLPERKFDAAGWQAVQRADDETRLHMVDDLITSGRLDGLNRQAVIALLGPPDGGNYFKEWDLVYWLGPERGFIRIDSEWLVIRFDRNGRVSEYKLAHD